MLRIPASLLAFLVLAGLGPVSAQTMVGRPDAAAPAWRMRSTEEPAATDGRTRVTERNTVRARSGEGNAVPWLGPSLDPPGFPEPPPPPGADTEVGPEPPAARSSRRGSAAAAVERVRRPQQAGRQPADPTVTRTVQSSESERAAPAGQGAVRAVEAAAPTPPGLRGLRDDPLTEDEDPDEQRGLRTPGLLWLPAVETSAGATNNVEGAANGSGGAVFSIAPELRLRSDWSRHAIDLDLRGSFTRYPGRSIYDTPTADLRAAVRLDLAEGMRLDLRSGYALTRESASSPDNPAGTIVPSDVTTWSGSIGFTRDAGFLFATLRGDVDMTEYSGGLTGAGPITSASARDTTRWVGAVRIGATPSPGLKPFVEAQAIDRTYADATAAAERDATGWALKAGAEIDTGPILRGEVSAGWATERPRSSALGELSGFVADGRLVWSPTRVVEVTATAATTLEPTSLSGSPGLVARTAGLDVAYRLMRNITLQGGATVAARDYEAVSEGETAYGATAAVIWRAHPFAQVFLRGRYEHTFPSAPNPDYGVATVLAGLRLQR